MTRSLRHPVFEFHIARAARERYGFDGSLYSLSGNVVLADLAAARTLARRVNERRRAATPPEPELSPGDLNAMGLIDEVLHFVAARFAAERDPQTMVKALAAIDRELGRERVDQALRAFSEGFPAVDVHRGRLDAAAWLAGESAGVPHRAMALEELLMLRLADENRAFAPFAELFDARTLAARSACDDVLAALERWFANRPAFGPFDQTLTDMLRAPARAHPESLTEQLDYIRRHWGYLLDDLVLRLLTGIDVLAEESRARWLRMHPPDWWRLRDSGADHVLRFGAGEHEPERFSPDLDWMPRVVLLAKSAYVWLDQLAKQYAREVRRLDQIPDEELDRLARRGITGVWLIGVWERSRASQRIKQLCGNPDAAASAYSLLSYSIADELGGEAALASLRERAWARGIRLASDMVPNHMGIDSHWVVEHPDWFLSLREPPFPAYSFSGPDLSSDARVTLQIEDHYYDRTDAAVVFRRIDRASGDTRFIYHGNDGTSYPWNDTAQLDYLKPEVREGLIQTILHVARQFPIIRFDAAMTLAKRHYQRLWFPEPGTGGAIPSRAEHGLTKAQFDALMPQEFWREVVDRAAVEAPDTLLLAEAFWLMEGYFVRTLGMHRVYNSAFMNMLRDEQNANYRSVIKNTLEFDPEILKRYVNFMSNPDERTAIDQFGKDDKYFGCCTLMVTLPGLPMFGHGQVEGFEERYGMEYRRAYRDERADEHLIARHEREIFPLLHRRDVFAEVHDFLLYDCFDDGGHVNEDVFTYSNRRGGERALVLFHNRYADVAGWIRISAASARVDGATKTLAQRSLGDGLALGTDASDFVRYRDFVSGLEYVKSSRDMHERGLRVELRAYERRVYLDFRDVRDSAREPWARLHHELDGRGVTSLDEALDDLRRRALTQPFAALLDAGALHELAAGAANGDGAARAALEAIESRARTFLDAAAAIPLGRGDTATLAHDVRASMEAMLAREAAAPAGGTAKRERAATGASEVTAPPAPDRAAARTWGMLLAYAALRALGTLAGGDSMTAARLGREWRLDRTLQSALEAAGLDSGAAYRASRLAFALLAHAPFFAEAARRQIAPDRVFAHWLGDDTVRQLLDVHRHEDVEWFRKESFEDWLGLLTATHGALEPVAAIAGRRAPATPAPEPGAAAPREWLTALVAHAHASGWRTDRLTAAAVSVVTRPPSAVATKPARRAPRRTGPKAGR